MRSPALPPDAVLPIVYVRVWVMPMSTSPAGAGAVCVMVKLLAAGAGMLTADKATSRARKHQRFMVRSREEFCGISAMKQPAHGALRASDIPHCRPQRLVVVSAPAGAVGELRPRG